MKRLYVTSLLALLTAGASAQANAPKPDGPGGFPARGERRAGQRMERRAERRADAIKEFDKDGDGKLNEEERKAMMEANRARMEEFRKAREKGVRQRTAMASSTMKAQSHDGSEQGT